MKKNLFVVVAAATVSLLFATCKKFDLHFKDPAQHCRIVSIIESRDGVPQHRTVTYDEWNNPVSVRYAPDEEGTGNPEFIFEYDDQHRLIRYEGFAEHRFFYDSQGQAVLDSVIGNYAGQDARFEEKLYYDVFGRLTKVVSKFYFSGADDPGVGTVTTEEFKYDSRGNLIRPNATYDHKKSMHRTHPVWMLVNRNYSLNNQNTVTDYNDKGLPTKFGNSTEIFLDKGMGGAEITYDCEEK